MLDMDYLLQLIPLKILAGIITLILSSIYLIFSKPSRESQLQILLRQCSHDMEKIIEDNQCYPLMLRLAWTDAASYDQTIKEWPACGGANGTIRFERNLDLPSNAGLGKGVQYLNELKFKYPLISWADMIQMAGALAVKLAGGPDIKLRYGRQDCNDSHFEVKENLLPCPNPPFPDGSISAEIHLRNIFYRMGFTNRDIVALSGAHTLGRAFADKTGACPLQYTSGEQGSTLYTRSTALVTMDDKPNTGIPGGISWTKQWLKFDNSYFSRIHSSEDYANLLWLPTDIALLESPEFKVHFMRYANSEIAFFDDYTEAHIKMSELGCKFSPPEGIIISNNSSSNNSISP